MNRPSISTVTARVDEADRNRETQHRLMRKTIAHEAVQLAMEQAGVRVRSDMHTLAEEQIEAVLSLVYRGFDSGTVPAGATPIKSAVTPAIMQAVSDALAGEEEKK